MKTTFSVLNAYFVQRMYLLTVIKITLKSTKNKSLFLINYKNFLEAKIHDVIEGESPSIEHETNITHLVKDRD
jgi:hypothetical protein